MGHEYDESVAKAIDRLSKNVGKWLSAINDSIKEQGLDQSKLDALAAQLKTSSDTLGEAVNNFDKET